VQEGIVHGKGEPTGGTISWGKTVGGDADLFLGGGGEKQDIDRTKK